MASVGVPSVIQEMTPKIGSELMSRIRTKHGVKNKGRVYMDILAQCWKSWYILWMKSIKLREAVTCKTHTVRNVWGSQSHIRTFPGPSLWGEGNFTWQTCQESTSSHKITVIALSFPRKLLIHLIQHSCSSSSAGETCLLCAIVPRGGWSNRQWLSTDCVSFTLILWRLICSGTKGVQWLH